MSHVLEVNDAGAITLPREVVGNAPPHTRYVVDHDGPNIVLRRADTGISRETRDEASEYMAQWDALAEDVDRAWKSDLSATEAVAEMRR